MSDPIWEDLLTETDRMVIEKGGYGKQRGLGNRPVLLILNTAEGAKEECIDNIVALKEEAGRNGIPVISITSENEEVMPELSALEGEVTIHKQYASAFFGTCLQSELVKRHADTVIIVGGRTSDSCRATAVDAITRSYNLAFVEDCMYDFIMASHKTALLDVWMKVGDVVNKEDVCIYLKQRGKLTEK